MRKLLLLVSTFALAACSLKPGQTPPPPTPAPASSPGQPGSVVPPASSSTSQPSGPRRPRGIYAEIHIDLQVDQQQKLNPSITAAELHSFLKDLYSSLLDNPAVSGLAIGIEWGRLNPKPPSDPQSYDWSYMDDAFDSVAAWNTANPGQTPKTVQVQISAGFGTPAWVLDQIPSCDGLFKSPPQTPSKDCGEATFTGFVEGGGGVLPLPWNAIYKKSFKTFLTAFAARYGSNPAFVSIDVSGPTAASTEMILPNDITAPKQAQFGDITPNEMWLKLLAFAYPGKPEYQKTDQAFIDEWNAAIDLFGEVFSDLTLVATTGSGLPNLGSRGYKVPAAFTQDCPTPDMDCAAEAAILAHFADPGVDPMDAKATQSSGMRGLGRTGTYDLGVHGVEWLAQSTSKNSSPAAQILGGEQFATSAALYPIQEGCTQAFPPKPKVGTSISVDPSTVPAGDIPQDCLAPGITPADVETYNVFSQVPARDLIPPEQALYNVLRGFFDGTPAASSFGGNPGTAPYNYLQIYSQDIKYATTHGNAPAQVVQADGTAFSTSAQDLLNLASQQLLEIGEPRSTP